MGNGKKWVQTILERYHLEKNYPYSFYGTFRSEYVISFGFGVFLCHPGFHFLGFYNSKGKEIQIEVGCYKYIGIG